MSPVDPAVWFTESVRPHEPALRAFLSRRFPSLPDHDDLVQETYARLLRISDPHRLAHARSFLFTIARNLAIHSVTRGASMSFEFQPREFLAGGVLAAPAWPAF